MDSRSRSGGPTGRRTDREDRPVAWSVEDTPRPVHDGVWTDDAGVRWELRGGGVALSRFRRLLGRPDVRVVHVTTEAVRDVPVVGREALRRRVEPFLKGAARAVGDHTDYLLGEFRDGAGGQLLIVEERC